MSRPALTVLRTGAALCFIGHGAFGFITKAAWLPYFAVAGIPESLAWRLMPLIGAVDVLAGFVVLLAPRRIALGYMVVWATWTALLRPLAGEPLWEALERAGNYGVPLALLLWYGWPRRTTLAALLDVLPDPAPNAEAMSRVRIVLRWSTALLLAGHEGLGATGKAGLAGHYAAVGLPLDITMWVGWFELALAVAVLARPGLPLLLFVVAWKLATESLFLAAGDRVWEVVERAGSYAAPLALAMLSWAPRVARSTRPSRELSEA